MGVGDAVTRPPVVAVPTLVDVVVSVAGAVVLIVAVAAAVSAVAVDGEGKLYHDLGGISEVSLWIRISVFQPGRPALDSRLADNSQDALVAALKSLKLKSDELPSRPGFGKEGRAITLRANFFPVRVPKGPLYEYDVSISPAAGTAARRVKRRIFQLAEDSRDWATHGLQGSVAHDHSSKLISAKPLPQPLSIKVPYYDEDEDGPRQGGKEYTLTIEFIQQIDTSALMKLVWYLCQGFQG